ncbi:hypothetical protein OHB00_45405 [Streptomyces sp. NBC_00631]|uniref:hypothetical protein n=1 Tax=Streptomyces sp. NBC_00631 TaxID=2975793 RepID=UPI0030E2AAE0
MAQARTTENPRSAAPAADPAPPTRVAAACSPAGAGALRTGMNEPVARQDVTQVAGTPPHRARMEVVTVVGAGPFGGLGGGHRVPGRLPHHPAGF